MWSPLNIKTHYSTCYGMSKPETILDKCLEYGYNSCAVTDINLSSSIAFYSAAKDRNIKPIIGAEIGNVLFLAKNKLGWLNLIKMTSNSNIFDYKEDSSLIAVAPRIDVDSNHILYEIFGEDFYYQDEVGAENKCLYVNDSDKNDYEIVISAEEGLPLNEINKFSQHHKELLQGNWSLKNNKITELFSKDIIKKNEEIVDKCEDYKIFDELNLPEFNVPQEFNSQYDYLVHLCRIGWSKKVKNRGLDEQVYVERVKKELSIIQRVGLEGYFLVVQDYVNWAKNQGWLIGNGRGSSSGSLVSHLLNITNIDPIKHNLIFERFYNDGRNTKDRKALPDIDTDFPKFKRPEVIDYITKKYGEKRVSHIVTHSELKGKSSIKEVLRANQVVPATVMNDITKYIPSKEEISDLLADDKETSILRWTLQNEPSILKDWVTIDDDGNINGSLSKYFEQAIRLEGTFIGSGKHASGVIISKYNLEDCCPMTKDKDGETIVAFDMTDLEKAGFVKFDILGLTALDKLMGINNLLRYGKINI